MSVKDEKEIVSEVNQNIQDVYEQMEKDRQEYLDFRDDWFDFDECYY